MGTSRVARKFIAILPRADARRRCMEGDAAAIDTAVAQREWQDGFTRLLSVRVLPDLPFLRPASPDL